MAAQPHDELPDEPRRERLLRHVQRVRLYSSATGIVVLLEAHQMMVSAPLLTVTVGPTMTSDAPLPFWM